MKKIVFIIFGMLLVGCNGYQPDKILVNDMENTVEAQHIIIESKEVQFRYKWEVDIVSLIYEVEYKDGIYTILEKLHPSRILL